MSYYVSSMGSESLCPSNTYTICIALVCRCYLDLDLLGSDAYIF